MLNKLRLSGRFDLLITYPSTSLAIASDAKPVDQAETFR
jgi:hypothetical protein